jgi:hypothetical protein
MKRTIQKAQNIRWLLSLRGIPPIRRRRRGAGISLRFYRGAPLGLHDPYGADSPGPQGRGDTPARRADRGGEDDRTGPARAPAGLGLPDSGGFLQNRGGHAGGRNHHHQRNTGPHSVPGPEGKPVLLGFPLLLRGIRAAPDGHRLAIRAPYPPYEPPAPLDYVPSRPYTGIVIYAKGPLPVHGEHVQAGPYPVFSPGCSTSG